MLVKKWHKIIHNMKKLIFILAVIGFSSCKKEYIGPEVVITAKRTNYYNGTGAVLPYREVSDTIKSDTIKISKDLQDRINKAFREFKKIEKERQIVQYMH